MLRNAFDNLSTESAIRKLLSMLTFARDQQDRIRTIVDGGSITIYNRSSGTNMGGDVLTIPFSSVSWNSMDAREEQRMRMRMASDAARKNRWTY